MVVTSAFVGERPPGVVEIELSVCQFLRPGSTIGVTSKYSDHPRESIANSQLQRSHCELKSLEIVPGSLGSDAVLDPPKDVLSTDELPRELCVVRGALLRYEPI